MAHWAKIGARCVCITDRWLADGCPADGPRKGEVCVVVSTQSFDGRIFLAVEGWSDIYGVDGFRPLVSEEQDIAMFRAIADRALHRKSTQIREPVE